MKRHVTDVLPSANGHLNQERKGLQSTKIPKQEIFELDHATIVKNITNLKKQATPTRSLEETIVKDIHDDAFLPSEIPNMKTNHVAYKIVEVETANKAIHRLDRAFPVSIKSW